MRPAGSSFCLLYCHGAGASIANHSGGLPDAGSTVFGTRTSRDNGANWEPGELQKFRNRFTISTLDQFHRVFRGPRPGGDTLSGRNCTLSGLLRQAGSECSIPDGQASPLSRQRALPRSLTQRFAARCSLWYLSSLCNRHCGAFKALPTFSIKHLARPEENAQCSLSHVPRRKEGCRGLAASLQESLHTFRLVWLGDVRWLPPIIHTMAAVGHKPHLPPGQPITDPS
ncbi:hypothetical protein VTI74DRAFT_10966 [Chaetomium olivicolor]